ncbi:hypothetical protein DPMN_159558 [Dreissena polymorpha]|uniref:Uncharacterized protein n=1 Tax=Dreissena polymorpha TaxID=45954 RepID=A0A9D4IQU1_DREPO|nr:hypothetical protein DPMN_159558 [Dreissena polymorpha]
MLCRHYSAISLNKNPSKVMLRFILNRLQNNVEKLLAAKKSERAGRSTVNLFFNSRICKTCNPIDLKKSLAAYGMMVRGLQHVRKDDASHPRTRRKRKHTFQWIDE